MAIRTVLVGESSSGAKQHALSYVVRVLTLAGPIRWLVATHTVDAETPWRRSCDACGTSLWRAVTGPSGMCASCGARIGAPPYTVEAGLVLAALFTGFAPFSIPVRAAAALWLLAALVLGLVDALVHRLPLRLVAAMTVATLVPLAVAAATEDRWSNLVGGLIAGAALTLVLFLLCLPRDGLGLGDAALAFPIGLAAGWFGFPTVVAWLLFTSIIAGFTGIALLMAHRATRKTRIPLGPYMLVAAILAIAIS